VSPSTAHQYEQEVSIVKKGCTAESHHANHLRNCKIHTDGMATGPIKHSPSRPPEVTSYLKNNLKTEHLSKLTPTKGYFGTSSNKAKFKVQYLA